MRIGCSLSELLTTYCSRGSLFPLLWLFPIKANSPKPDEQEARAAAAVTTRLLKKTKKKTTARSCAKCPTCKYNSNSDAKKELNICSHCVQESFLFGRREKGFKSTQSFCWFGFVCFVLFVQRHQCLLWLSSKKKAWLNKFYFVCVN